MKKSDHTQKIELPEKKNKFFTWLSIEKFPHRLQTISITYFTILMFESVGFHITDTFLTLYLLDTISWQQVSLVFGTQIAVQLVFDYPTGALGDWIGQRIVLTSAYVLKMVSILFVLFFSSFPMFLVYGCLSGLANSQISGTLDSWFDSRYRNLIVDRDPKRELFTNFKAILYIFYLGLAGLTTLISGLIASVWSRRSLFLIQMVLYLLMIFIVVKYITKIPPTQMKLKQYLLIFQSGLKYTFSNVRIWSFFMGVALTTAFLDGLWTKLILFPFFKEYAVSDVRIGLLRGILLTIDLFLLSQLKKIPAKSKKIRLGYILAQSGIISGIGLAGVYYLLFPAPPTFNMIYFCGLILIGIILGIPYRLSYLFYTRIMIDLVPDHIRNSIYSLVPSLITALTIPATYLGGFIIEQSGLLGGIITTVISGCVGISLTIFGLRKPSNEKYISS